MNVANVVLRTGLVSVTFRALAPERVVTLAAANGLEAIEWGGDVHCPPGDVANARRVRDLAASAGLTTSAYGSYYRVGTSTDFDAVLATAVALGAPAVRVWAGTVGSARATPGDRDRIARDLAAVCDAAAREGLVVALEYHGDTLTDTPTSAVALIEAVARPNLATYWQPRHGLSVEQHLADLATLQPWLRDVHVFHWWPTPAERRPLAEGADRWRDYLRAIAADGRPRVASLEFVLDDDEAQFVADAHTLRELVRGQSMSGRAARTSV